MNLTTTSGGGGGYQVLGSPPATSPPFLSSTGDDLGNLSFDFDFDSNFSNWTNTTDEPTGLHYTVWQQAIIGIILSVIIGGTIIGNTLVILAVGLVKKLRTPSNILIVSLAVSDLSVAVLDMPFAAMYELRQVWTLGETVCDLWTSLDVMLCTASILNLCMISIDRYFVITRPFTYMIKRTPKLMALMITVAWVSSALISIPPLIGWKQEYIDGRCGVSNELGYQIYATIGAFYVPLTVMIVVYGRIFLISKRLSKSGASSHPAGRPADRPSGGSGGPGNWHIPPISALKRDSNEENHNFPNGSAKRCSKDSQDDSKREMLPKKNTKSKFQLKKFGHRQSRNNSKGGGESKATRTLGVIMGGFTLCWLPFFICALCKPFKINPPHWLEAFFMWLGFLNSFLNPIIYAKFNRDFRKPFKEILLFRCRGLNRKVRSDSYVDQYGGPLPLRDSIRRESNQANSRRESFLNPPSRRESTRPLPPAESIVRCNVQGETSVRLGNGAPLADGEATL
ncbi:5-hydroxytryptamine receptor 1A-like [Lineus longissimus]|uniref:5-hydroxytryptamine receptor 1A-like n=1 Tax=Lineus longissimus TaxID=88925 RepID=UPI00315DDCD5